MLVRVQARPDRGRWRCGVFWPHSWVEADVDDKQLAALEADTQLVVHRAEQRNEALPTAKSVQPDPNKPKHEPVPWGDRDLERRRQEALRLDAEAKAEADALRQLQAEEELTAAEDDDAPRDFVEESHQPKSSGNKTKGKGGKAAKA